MSYLLLVEDDDDIRCAYVMMFEQQGHQVSDVSSAEMALEQLKIRQFDLVITDLLLPGIDGAELCRMIRSNGRHDHVPVVLVTCMRDRMGIEITDKDSNWAPFDCIIDKNSAVPELFDTVGELLERRGTQE